MKINEKDVIQYLTNLGISTIRKDVEWKTYGRKRVDLVGYIIDSTGMLVPQVVVEIKSKSNPEVQSHLAEASKVLDVPYALLVVDEQKYWYEAKQFLPLIGEIPTFNNSLPYLESEQEIKSILEKCFLKIMELSAFLTLEQNIKIIAFSLLVRVYLEAEGEKGLEKWDTLNSDTFNNLVEQSVESYGISTYFHLNERDENVLQDIIPLLRTVPPKHSILGKIFLEFVEIYVRKKSGTMYITPPSLRSLFLDIAKVTVGEGSSVNLGTGYGSLLYDMTTLRRLETLHGVEINPEICAISQISLIISGLENTKVKCVDALKTIRKEEDHYNFVFMDVPLERLEGDRVNEYEDYYKVMEDSRRRKFDLSELFIELSIGVCSPGGYILTTIPESLLFSSATKPIRNFIHEKCIVEAIISLPSHIFKPFSPIKSSLLLLKKKLQHGEKGKQIFMAKVDSLDDLSTMVDSFIAYKDSGDIN